MANAPTETDYNPIDRLSDLPDALLITILSFLPTHIAARTSALSRRFRHLWEASPSLALISRDLPHPQCKNFVAMAKRVLLGRNPSHPLLSFHMKLSCCCDGRNVIAMVPSLLAKAHSLDLPHLTLIDFWLSDFLPILPIIFTINSLRCLSLHILGAPSQYPEELNFPSAINLTCLRSLSLKLIRIYPANLNQLLSELCSLDDLHLEICGTAELSLSSQTIRKLELIIGSRQTSSIPKLDLDIVGLSLPSLESLHLGIQYSLRNLSQLHAKVPLLKKAVINLYDIHERNVSAVAGLLNDISHVEELSLLLQESTVEMYPIPILLESGKYVANYSNLKHLDVTLCFHEHNFEAVTRMLHNCPVLKSLKLVHETPYFTGLVRGQKRKDWRSMLPRNADGNFRYAYFRNLHLGEDRKAFMKLLNKKCTSKRQACN